MKRVVDYLVPVMYVLLARETAIGQTNYSMSVSSILNAMPAGRRLPDGTIVRAQSITIRTGVLSSNTGLPGPTFEATYTGTTLTGYLGSNLPADFTRLETSNTATVDNGTASSGQDAIGFRIYFDRPVLHTNFLAIDIDGNAGNPGNAEWLSAFGYNGNTYVSYTRTTAATTFLAGSNFNSSSATYSWRTFVGSILGATAATNFANTVNIARGDGGNLSYDDTRSMGLFRTTTANTPVTDFFYLWGVWPVPANMNVQGCAVSPVVVSLSPDFGDLPDSYQTLLASNGASHGTSANLFLGSGNTTEANGTPSALANGDAGDNGVIVSPIANKGWMPELIPAYSLTTSFTNTSGLAANYVAWIDWNTNGTFEASEAATAATPAGSTSGNVTFNWNNVTLSGAVGANHSYARIRVTTEAITTADAGGAFKDGEVEDYYIPFALALPLQLLNFSGRIENEQAVLNWATANEYNNAGFELQHSADGLLFTRAAYTASAGPGDHYYTLRTPLAFAGTNYYRLKMIENDGSFSYSPLVTLRTRGTGGLGLILSPNPVAATLLLRKAGTELLTIHIYDTRGQVVKTLQVSSSIQWIDCQELKKGLYYLRATDAGGRSETLSFIK